MEYDSDKKVKVEDENLCLICYEEFSLNNPQANFRSYFSDDHSDYEKHKLHDYICLNCYIREKKCPFCRIEFKKNNRDKYDDAKYKELLEALEKDEEITEDVLLKISKMDNIKIITNDIFEYRKEIKSGKKNGKYAKQLAVFIFGPEMDKVGDDDAKIDNIKNDFFVLIRLQNLSNPELNNQECTIKDVLDNGLVLVKFVDRKGSKPVVSEFTVEPENLKIQKLPGLTDSEYRSLKEVFYNTIKKQNLEIHEIFKKGMGKESYELMADKVRKLKYDKDSGFNKKRKSKRRSNKKSVRKSKRRSNKKSVRKS